MGDEPYFDGNVMRRVIFTEIAESLKAEVSDMVGDCPTITEDTLNGQVKEGAKLLSLLCGAARSESIRSREDWSDMAAGFYELSDAMDTTTANITVLVFAVTWLGIIGDPRHWEHQTHSEVVSLLDEVKKTGET